MLKRGGLANLNVVQLYLFYSFNLVSGLALKEVFIFKVLPWLSRRMAENRGIMIGSKHDRFRFILKNLNLIHKVEDIVVFLGL